MKTSKLLFLFLLPFFSKSCFSYSIVFIHIGNTYPAYLNVAIEQALLFNKQADVYVVANRKNQDCLPKHQQVVFVAAEALKPSQEHRLFLQKTRLEKSSLEGFWLYTSERFFFLDELVQAYNLQHVFHLESDNMLYVNLEELMSIFSAYYPYIGATFDNEERCVAGFIYFSNPSATRQLVQFMARHAQEGLTDMYSIAKFRQAHPEWIGHLPIIPKEYADHFPLRSTQGHIAKQVQSYYQHVEFFGSLFDGAAIGQYLGGNDPMHRGAHVGFVNESCLFNPKNMNYVWETDQENRKIPYAVFRGNKYRLNNLHIHSKHLSQFTSTQ